MRIKYATMEDLAAVAAVEAKCFPPAEAATEKEFTDRIRYYGNHFWLMYEGKKLIAFVDGFVTDEPDLTDEMYENAAMHNENGTWQMIFGVNTLPDYRRQGYAGELICRAIEDARMQGRKGLVLTCKEKLISYYGKYGFVDELIETGRNGNMPFSINNAFGGIIPDETKAKIRNLIKGSETGSLADKSSEAFFVAKEKIKILRMKGEI